MRLFERVYDSLPDTLQGVMASTGLTEQQVFRAFYTLRSHGVRVERRGPRAERYFEALDPLPRGEAKTARKPRQRAPSGLIRLYSAPEATPAQVRAVTAKAIRRDCLRCKASFSTTRNGPRYCDTCRAHITRRA